LLDANASQAISFILFWYAILQAMVCFTMRAGARMTTTI